MSSWNRTEEVESLKIFYLRLSYYSILNPQILVLTKFKIKLFINSTKIRCAVYVLPSVAALFSINDTSIGGKFCSNFTFDAKSPPSKLSRTNKIIAQHMFMRKSKRWESANRVSQILSTSGRENSWDSKSVSHLKL